MKIIIKKLWIVNAHTPTYTHITQNKHSYKRNKPFIIPSPKLDLIAKRN